MKRLFVAVFLGLAIATTLGLPVAARAQETQPRFPIPDLQIRIPGVEKILTDPTSVDCVENVNGDENDEDDKDEECLAFPWIGQYISSLYVFGVYAATIVAAIVIMVGGFLWLTSGGNTNQIGSAKGYITGAVLGLMLMLGSYTVLRLVNPNLVQFTALRIPILKRVTVGELAAKLYEAGGTVVGCILPNGKISSDGNISAELLQAINTFGDDPEINAAFVAAIIKTESSFVSQEGPATKLGRAYGLMQILPTTAEEIWKQTSSRPSGCSTIYEGTPPRYTDDCKKALDANPQEQVRMGTFYLKQIRDKMAKCGQAGNMSLVAAGYNAGPNLGTLCRGKVPNFPATVDYVKKVNGSTGNFCIASKGSIIPPAPPPDFVGPPVPPEYQSEPIPTTLPPPTP